jgi:hypothetical protein
MIKIVIFAVSLVALMKADQDSHHFAQGKQSRSGFQCMAERLTMPVRFTKSIAVAEETLSARNKGDQG